MCDPKEKNQREKFLKKANLGKVKFWKEIIVLGDQIRMPIWGKRDYEEKKEPIPFDVYQKR